MAYLDVDKLIVEIEERPAIWDTRCNDYSNKFFRGAAWQEICNILIPDFEEMDFTRKNIEALTLQRRWKSLRDSFRRELSKIRKWKNGSTVDTGRKEYIYFKQLSFLMPVCEFKPREDEPLEVATEEKNTEIEDQVPIRGACQKRKRKSPESEEQALFQNISRNVYRKKKDKEPDDPDKQFLLGLLPHFQILSESGKLDVKGEFINILKWYTRHPAYVNQQFVPSSNHFLPGPSSTSRTLHFSPSYMSTQRMEPAGTLMPSQIKKLGQSTSPDVTQEMSPSSEDSDICDNYFP